MRRFLIAIFVLMTTFGLDLHSRFHAQVVNSIETSTAALMILDDAIKASGQVHLQERFHTFRYTARGIDTRGQDSGKDKHVKYSSETIVHNFANYHISSNWELDGFTSKSIMVLSGKNGWEEDQTKIPASIRTYTDKEIIKERDELETETIPYNLNQLKDKKYKLEWRGLTYYHFPNALKRTKDRPANIIRVTKPDGERFHLWFDQDNKLLVRQDETLMGPLGEMCYVYYYDKHKLFDGIIVPTVVYIKEIESSEYYAEYRDTFEAYNLENLDIFKKPAK